jgi:predicted transcriptional regulator
MTSEASLRYRSRCRIFADLLRAVEESEEAKVTYLMHKANLSYDRLNFYIETMESSGLIERRTNGDKTSFLATKKGKKYLAEFKRLEEFGDAFGVEI